MLNDMRGYTIAAEITENEIYYFASFTDNNGKIIYENETITLELARTILCDFSREEKRIQRKVERKEDAFTAVEKIKPFRNVVEFEVINKMELDQALALFEILTFVERKRLFLHVIEKYKFEQIAKLENCSATAVRKSIRSGREKIALAMLHKNENFEQKKS